MKASRKILIALIIAWSGLFTHFASAVVVEPGGTAFIPGTTLSAYPELGGTTIYESTDHYEISSPNIAFPTIAGHVYKNQVIQSDLSGNLVFSLQLIDGFNATEYSTIYIDAISLSGYAGWDADIVYRTDAVGDLGPTFVQRSNDGDLFELSFGFPLALNNLTEGVRQDSLPIQILTGAQAFDTSGRAVVNARGLSSATGEWDAIEVYMTGLAVPAAVPLPASLPLLLSGIGLLVAFRKKSGL